MPIEVGVDFIFRLADNFGITPGQAFARFCTLQPFLISPPYDYVLAVALKKPCPFFKKGCRIHIIKPSACLTFPARICSMGYSQGFDAYPCLTGELPKPEKQELKFSELLRQKMHARTFQLLNEKILYSGNQPYLNLKESAQNNPELKKIIMVIVEEKPLDASSKIRLKKIIRKEFSSILSENQISKNLDSIKKTEQNAVKKLNHLYNKLRKKHRI